MSSVKFTLDKRCVIDISVICCAYDDFTTSIRHVLDDLE